VTPAFVRGAFDLRPQDRLDATLHREVIARLVPEWKRIDFFSAGSAAMPEIVRRRIWEREREAASVTELIAGDGSWAELFDRNRIREMWAEVRAGEGSADYEHVFDRIVWRASFDAHLERLGAAAGSQP
jgi:hypothetical protein